MISLIRKREEGGSTPNLGNGVDHEGIDHVEQNSSSQVGRGLYVGIELGHDHFEKRPHRASQSATAERRQNRGGGRGEDGRFEVREASDGIPHSTLVSTGSREAGTGEHDRSGTTSEVPRHPYPRSTLLFRAIRKRRDFLNRPGASRPRSVPGLRSESRESRGRQHPRSSTRQEARVRQHGSEILATSRPPPGPPTPRKTEAPAGSEWARLTHTHCGWIFSKLGTLETAGRDGVIGRHVRGQSGTVGMHALSLLVSGSRELRALFGPVGLHALFVVPRSSPVSAVSVVPGVALFWRPSCAAISCLMSRDPLGFRDPALRSTQLAHAIQSRTVISACDPHHSSRDPHTAGPIPSDFEGVALLVPGDSDGFRLTMKRPFSSEGPVPSRQTSNGRSCVSRVHDQLIRFFMIDHELGSAQHSRREAPRIDLPHKRRWQNERSKLAPVGSLELMRFESRSTWVSSRRAPDLDVSTPFRPRFWRF